MTDFPYDLFGAPFEYEMSVSESSTTLVLDKLKKDTEKVVPHTWERNGKDKTKAPLHFLCLCRFFLTVPWC